MNTVKFTLINEAKEVEPNEVFKAITQALRKVEGPKLFFGWDNEDEGIGYINSKGKKQARIHYFKAEGEISVDMITMNNLAVNSAVASAASRLSLDAVDHTGTPISESKIEESGSTNITHHQGYSSTSLLRSVQGVQTHREMLDKMRAASYVVADGDVGTLHSDGTLEYDDDLEDEDGELIAQSVSEGADHPYDPECKCMQCAEDRITECQKSKGSYSMLEKLERMKQRRGGGGPDGVVNETMAPHHRLNQLYDNFVEDQELDWNSNSSQDSNGMIVNKVSSVGSSYSGYNFTYDLESGNTVMIVMGGDMSSNHADMKKFIALLKKSKFKVDVTD